MKKVLFLLGLGVVFLAELSLASTGGVVASQTQDFWNEAKNFIQGPGGALLALAGVGWGLYSFIRGSIFMGAAGVLGGIGLYKIPDIIDAVFTFTI